MHDLSTLRKALEHSPGNVSLWLLYGQTCTASHDFREAREAYDRALSLSPEEPEAQLGIAQVLFLEGKLSEAEVRTQSLLSVSQTFAPGHLLLSRIYLAERNGPKAAEHYCLARALSKSLADRDIEGHLRRLGLGTSADRGEPPRLVANSRWESDDDFENSDPFDDEMASYEEPSIEQEEFPFVEDEGVCGYSLEDFDRPAGCFEDVAGLDEVKDELLMKLVYPYDYQDLFRAYRKKAGGGVLLHGPPGCGKSLVCRSLAGETEAAFFCLKLHQILEMYIGCSEKNLHELFQAARDNTPSIIFIDELDAIAADRSDLKHNAARAVVNQLLMEMDGYDGSNEGILIIAATSAIWNVDPAFLRPGRFDRRIHVPPPDRAARLDILRLQAKSRPAGELDLEKLADMTDDFSGADLGQVFDLAIEDALRVAMRKREVVPISMPMLEHAVRRVEPSVRLWRDIQARRQGPPAAEPGQPPAS